MEVGEADGGWTVTPPSCRFDIAIEEDLVEEVVRITGYDRVPSWTHRGDRAARKETAKRASRSAGFAGSWSTGDTRRR